MERFTIRSGHWQFVLTIAILLALTASARGSTHATSKQVIAAIRKGVGFLLAQEQPKTMWEEGIHGSNSNGVVAQENGGESALVLESLLYVQQSLHLRRLNLFKPKMQAAIKYVVKLRSHCTYVSAFQAGAMDFLPQKRNWHVRTTLFYDRGFLLGSAHEDGGFTYAFYPAKPKGFPRSGGDWDNSNTQNGVLGIWACQHGGIPIPRGFWYKESRHWRGCQYGDGEWGYWGVKGQPTKPTARAQTFTPAGLASLLMADEFMQVGETVVRPKPDHAVSMAVRWMNANFSPTNQSTYSMYSVLRAGLATGIKIFNKHNWYQDFADQLVENQSPDGSWRPDFYQASSNTATAYALLILTRGLNPVFMNKLEYGKHYLGKWNSRQWDVASLTASVSRGTGVALNWQVVKLSSPVKQWLDSPILFLSGYVDPKFTPQQIAKFSAFTDAGGIIFCTCNQASLGFKNAMIQDGQLASGGHYEFHTLSSKSPIYTIEPWANFHVPLLGLSNGVRYTWIICPTDLGEIWQRHAMKHKTAWELPENLYLYATGKGYIADRLQSVYVPSPTTPPTKSMTVGLLKYAGNWNPEPGAWPRLGRLMALHHNLTVHLNTVGYSKLDPAKMQLLHATGTGLWHPDVRQRTELKTYLENGGTLFADAIGGGSAWGDSFIKVMQDVFPKDKFQPVPATSRILNGSAPGMVALKSVTYRKYFLDTHKARNTVDMLGIKRHGRWVVLFTPYDVTCGLLGSQTWSIAGLTPADAQTLAENILLYLKLPPIKPVKPAIVTASPTPPAGQPAVPATVSAAGGPTTTAPATQNAPPPPPPAPVIQFR